MGVPFGRYVLERRLAIGGMAEIFLGRSEGPAGFAKRLVVKRILPNFVDNESFVRMFLDEAAIGSRFSHPNLVHVFDLVEVGGQYAIVMEFVEGKDLHNIISFCRSYGRPIPASVAVHITLKAAEGLHHAHQVQGEDGEPLNIVHRDVSPANIIVTAGGGIKVVDFGVAKSAANRTKTQTGVIKGKKSYMSPEQARAKQLDHRSDIFSLGSTFYELLTLTSPFRASSGMETLDAIVSGQFLSPRFHRPELPVALDRILARMLAVHRDDRYATCRELVRDLRRKVPDLAVLDEEDLKNFLNTLYGPTVIHKERWFAAVGGDDLHPVSDQLSPPSVAISNDEYQLLVDEVGTGEDATVIATEPMPSLEVASLVADTMTGTTTETPNPLLGTTTETPNPLLGTTTESPNPLMVGPTDPDQPNPVTQPPSNAELPPEPGTVMVPPPARPMSAEEQQRQLEEVVGPRPPVAIEPSTRAAAWPPSTARLVSAITIGLVALASVVALAISMLPDRPLRPQIVEPLNPVATPFRPPEPAKVEPAELQLTEEKLPPAEEKLQSTTEDKLPPTRTETPAPARLVLTCSPKADVYLDGKKIGSTPLRENEVIPGPHTVEFRVPRWGLKKKLELNLEPGRAVRRRVSFPKGKVTIRVTPWGEVYLHGRKLGETPMPPFSLYEGRHVLEIVNSELDVTRQVPVTVKAGQMTPVNIELE